jgi:alanyl-tRNA synthetase
LELLRLQDRNASERLEYAVGQFHELLEATAQLAQKSGNAQPSPDQSMLDIRKQLEGMKHGLSSPPAASTNLRSAFDDRARREYSLESLLLTIAEKRKAVDRELSKSRLQSQSGSIDEMVKGAQSVGDIKVVSTIAEVQSIDELKSLGDTLRAKLGRGVGLLAAVIDQKVTLVCVVTDDLVGQKQLEAGKIVGAVARILGGGGGGKAHLATAGGKDASKLPEALAATLSIVESMMGRS